MKRTNIHTLTKRWIPAALLTVCGWFSSSTAQAQESVNVLIHENGTERQESIELPRSMTYPLDSLMNEWKVKNYIESRKDCRT